MDIELLKSKFVKEQSELKKLKEKKAKINEQIKAKNKKVSELENQILQNELSNAKQVLQEKGFSLDDLLKAVENGELKKSKE